MSKMRGLMSVRRLTMLAVTLMITGCSIEQELSRTPRTAVEQVLLTQAIERALVNMTVRLPEGVNVGVDATGLDSDRSRLRLAGSDVGTSNSGTTNNLGTMNTPSREIRYIRDTVAAELGRRGYRVRDPGAASPYLIRVMAESFGTMQGISFFGMPAVQSVLIPFALPELILYRHVKQSGYTRLHLDVYDDRTGEFLGSTAKLVGRSYYDQYTILFFITWFVTDIAAPP
jgi:hypothetical protein